MAIALYFAAAIFVGWLGHNKQIGFAGFFLLSLVATPIVALVVLMIAHDRRSQKPS